MADDPRKRDVPATDAIRGLLATGGRTYGGADQANAARVVGLICSLSALLTLAFLPLEPPTGSIGGLGWLAAGALIVLGFAGGGRLRRSDPPPGFDALLLVSYLGLLQVLALAWLADGLDSLYRELTLIWIGSAMGIHPVGRALSFLAVAALVSAAPLAWEGWSSEAAIGILADFLLWAVLGLVLLGLMSYVRAQRIELREQEREAQTLARIDELTGLGNRRAFTEALESELARSWRASSVTSVALLDLDRFKQINDRFGHLDGDRCLRDVSAAIQRALRAGDRAFRWGGDEFALVLADTDLEGAQRSTARIAAEVLNTCSTADGTPLSISWGAAEAEDEMGTVELLGRADLALMTLKREKLEA